MKGPLRHPEAVDQATIGVDGDVTAVHRLGYESRGTMRLRPDRRGPARAVSEPAREARPPVRVAPREARTTSDGTGSSAPAQPARGRPAGPRPHWPALSGIPARMSDYMSYNRGKSTADAHGLWRT
jgi:hypothetical protein